jgi:hypothetical protein
MIPIDNTVAGRVADIHHLMPASDLFIVGEHFLRVRHQLLVLPGTSPDDLKCITSHTHALGQCRRVIAEMGLEAVVAVDTAGAAKDLARTQDRSTAVIASTKAAEIYGLEVLRADIEDEDHNTTRFVVMSAEPDDATPDEAPVITSFIFTVRNVPAALYKAMGGFATNGGEHAQARILCRWHLQRRPSSTPTSRGNPGHAGLVPADQHRIGVVRLHQGEVSRRQQAFGHVSIHPHRQPALADGEVPRRGVVERVAQFGLGAVFGAAVQPVGGKSHKTAGFAMRCIMVKQGKCHILEGLEKSFSKFGAGGCGPGFGLAVAPDRPGPGRIALVAGNDVKVELANLVAKRADIDLQAARSLLDRLGRDRRLEG